MRLLRATDLSLHEFFDEDIPTYAILSHRWEESEVSYEDIIHRKASHLRGWTKLQNCCAQALQDGWEYVVGAAAYCKTSNLQVILNITFAVAYKETVDRHMLYKQV